MSNLSWQDFEKVDMRIGTVLAAQAFPEAHNPSYKLTIDFGSALGVLKSSAQITTQHTLDELIGMQVIAVVNFPKKQIGKFMSECLLLGAVDGKDVILLNPEHKVINGSAVS